MVVSTGEQVAIGLISIALKEMGIDAVSLTGWQVPIYTDDAHTKARIKRLIQEGYFQNLIKEG